MSRKGSRRSPKSDLHKRLGDELGRLREARGLKQRELASLVGKSPGHVANIENGLQAPSPELLTAWVEVCGGHAGPLYVLLQRVHERVEAQNQARRVASKPAALVTAEDFYDPPDPAQLYTIVTSDMRFALDERGFGKESRVTLSIRARVPGVDRYFTGWHYNGNTERGVVVPMNGFGCTIGEFAESDQGAVHGYFKLNRVLSPDDEPYEFSFCIRYNAKHRAIPPSTAQFRANALRHGVSIQFTGPALPTRVWWFDVETAVEAEADPPDAHVFPPDQEGYYYKEFIMPREGRHYGISYRWA